MTSPTCVALPTMSPVTTCKDTRPCYQHSLLESNASTSDVAARLFHCGATRNKGSWPVPSGNSTAVCGSNCHVDSAGRSAAHDDNTAVIQQAR